MRRHLKVAAAAVVTVLVATACSGGDDGNGEDLPDAAELLGAAADEMATVETVALQLESETDVADLPVRGLDGVITRAGEAEGTAQIEQLGQRVELQFVVVDDTVHYQLVGGWQELPRGEADDFYDPSALLDPDRGMANLLRTATDGEVAGREDDAYQVTATFDRAALAELVPGAGEDPRGTVWIGVERPLLHRADLPVSAGPDEVGTVTVRLSEFDEPVTISAP